jgi:hypothetical protein
MRGTDRSLVGIGWLFCGLTMLPMDLADPLLIALLVGQTETRTRDLSWFGSKTSLVWRACSRGARAIARRVPLACSPACYRRHPATSPAYRCALPVRLRCLRLLPPRVAPPPAPARTATCRLRLPYSHRYLPYRLYCRRLPLPAYRTFAIARFRVCALSLSISAFFISFSYITIYYLSAIQPTFVKQTTCVCGDRKRRE